MNTIDKNKVLFINTQLSTNNKFNNLNKLVTIYENTIILNRDEQKEPPTTLGVYNVVEFNVRLGLFLNQNPFNDVETDVDLFLEFNKLIKNNINIINEKYDKVIFINNLLLKDEYKGIGLFEEFVEHIYRTLYDTKTLIVFLIKPIQMLRTTFFIYRSMKKIVIKTKFGSLDLSEVSVDEYFNLGKLTNKFSDLESQTYKLYSKAQKNGLKMFDIDNLFYISESKVIENIRNKYGE